MVQVQNLFTDYDKMVGKRPRQTYFKELQDVALHLQGQLDGSLTPAINISQYKEANIPIRDYPIGLSVFEVSEESSTGYPALNGVVETVYINEFKNIQHFFEFTGRENAGATSYRQWNSMDSVWSNWVRVLTSKELEEHVEDKDQHITREDRTRLDGHIHSQTEPSTKWVILHGMNKFPSVTVVDSGGNTVLADVRHISFDEVEINFGMKMIGSVYLN